MNKPVIIICGATASGKTAIASHLCREIQGEIISADSRQIYRHLDAGTNKSGTYDAEKRMRFTPEGVPQHLTDLLDPDEYFSAGDFVREALRIINELFEAGKTPVVTGGTGMYLRALVHGLAPMPERNDSIRLELKDTLKQHGVEYLCRELEKIDHVSAGKNGRNPQRIIRAIEVYRLTGKPISALQAATVKPKFKFVQFAADWSREDLNSNINNRAKAMLGSGMIEETRKALARGYGKSSPGLGSLGYGHVIDHVSGLISLEQTIDRVALDTRHYAKRQLTWFRKEADLRWIKTGKDLFIPSEIAAKIKNAVKI